jgi:hypothetical protein
MKVNHVAVAAILALTCVSRPADAAYLIRWQDAATHRWTQERRANHEAAKELADAVSSRPEVAVTLIVHHGKVVGRVGTITQSEAERAMERAMERACGDRGANDAWPDAQGRIHVTCD